jgi:hypothetical protein
MLLVAHCVTPKAASIPILIKYSEANNMQGIVMRIQPAALGAAMRMNVSTTKNTVIINISSLSTAMAER